MLKELKEQKQYLNALKKSGNKRLLQKVKRDIKKIQKMLAIEQKLYNRVKN